MPLRRSRPTSPTPSSVFTLGANIDHIESRSLSGVSLIKVFFQSGTDSGQAVSNISSLALAEAQRSSEIATRDQILFVTDQAFYNVLQAQAVLRVAQQTVATRQIVQTQIRGLARNNLRSTLDASFADVNVSEAQLLLLDAQSNVADAIANLDDRLAILLALLPLLELSQAELAQTQMDIEFANAGYAYRAALAALRFQTAQQP